MNLKNHFESFESYIPVDLSDPQYFALAFFVVFGFIVVRYFLLVGAFYFPFWKRGSLKAGSLHDQKIKSGQVAYEIKWSMVSSLIFALSGVVMGLFWQKGWTRIYLEFDRYGLTYLFVSVIVLTLIHEIYFYLTHVWMHQPRVFKRVHYVHHFSKKTSPWASFSFHPYEAIVQAAFLPLAVLFLPLHPVMLIFYLTFMTVTAISNHLGYELIRSRFVRSMFISGTHHSEHHEHYSCNFGLYYTWSDKLFQTESRVKA